MIGMMASGRHVEGVVRDEGEQRMIHGGKHPIKRGGKKGADGLAFG
jgi:hypothetical protein